MSYSQASAPGGNGLAVISFAAGLVPLVAVALSWLVTYSPLSIQAYSTLQTIVDVTLISVSVVAACCALIIGIVALVRSRRYLGGKARLGFAIVGVMLGGLEAVIFALAAAFLVVLALNP